MAEFSIRRKSITLPESLKGRYGDDKIHFVPIDIPDHYVIVRTHLGIGSSDGIEYKTRTQAEIKLFGECNKAEIVFAFYYKDKAIIKLINKEP